MLHSLRSLAAPFSYVLVGCLFLTALGVPEAEARKRGLSIVRDAEIESLVAEYARPLMKAAGLKRGSVRFLIAADPSFNAFVSGRNMVLNTGLLMTAESPNEVIGVIAHELGHIVGGHQVRLGERARNARLVARIGTLLGVGATLAGAAGGNGDIARAGQAIAIGSGSVARSSVLAYMREEETNADRTAARLLDQTGQSGRGMLTTFERLSRSLGLSRSANPYRNSHPMPRQRITALRDVVSGSRHFKKRDSKRLQERHDLARAKIAAYLADGRAGNAVLQSKSMSPIARSYGRTILTHLQGSPKKAVPMIDRLVKQRPKYPYFHEMKGEILLKAGRPEQAIAPFKRAIKLDRSGNGFMRTELGHALVEAGGKSNAKRAVSELRKGVLSDAGAIRGYAYLARAYSTLGREGDALLASAEAAYRGGRKDRAKSFARRAQAKLKRGSPAWLRANDIVR